MAQQKLPPDVLPSEISDDDMKAHMAALINKVNREIFRLDNKLDGLEVEIGTAGDINKEKFKKNDDEHTHFQSKHSETMTFLNSMMGEVKGIRAGVEKLEPEKIISFMETMQPALKERKDLQGFWAVVNKHKGWMVIAGIALTSFMGWLWTIIYPLIKLGFQSWLKTFLGT